MRRRGLFPVSLAVLALALIALVGYQIVSYDTANSAAQPTSLNVTVSLSTPSNGSFFVAGEQAEVTVLIKENSGKPLTRADIATLGLYAYGPQETTKTVSAVKLLNATTDRTKTPHHYIDLLTTANVRVDGNTLRYALQPVSDEEAGTYTVGVRAVRLGNTADQTFALVDFQVGTATVEKQIVDRDKCAACHLGASSGQFYFRHTDPTATNANGSPSLDSWPVRTCKACHNNEGYAAYTSPADGARVPDQIVNRVHGIHNGEDLKNPLNTDPTKGVFRDWTSVVFPANVQNCTACHADDRWKTQPSKLACTTCHDNLWLGDAAALPKGGKVHAGGPQANDGACSACHTADTGGVAPISVVHKVSQPLNAIDISITPPANGSFYVAGEAPLVTLVIKDDNGNPIDHTKVDVASFSTAAFFVYGDRAEAVPVLTNSAVANRPRASAANTKLASGTPAGWTFSAGDTFKVAVNGGAPVVIAVPAGLQTPAQVRDLLAARLSGVTVTSTATAVTIRSNIQGEKSEIDIYNSPVTTIMGWKNAGIAFSKGMTTGVTQEPYVKLGVPSTNSNDLRKLSDPLDYADPNVTRNVENITYQLYDVAGLAPGTYMMYSYVLPVAGKTPNVSRTGIGFTKFQIGTATEQKKAATNCTQCHGNTIWHLDEGPIHPEPFDTDYCLACHDYGRPGTGESFPQVGGSSTNGWAGFGAKPISARVHGVHFGRYLAHPEQVYGGNPDAFSEVIFPQDVRNCTKCHDPKTTDGQWRTGPSRLACTGCHDKDVVNAHAKLQTLMEVPEDPYNIKNLETCVVCHGPKAEFSVERVHNISDPYAPPYLREPAE
ncbi:MAG: hypothetical protein Q7R39_13465 [Dehalococcoidia bacterium]|nr:hypothetical protein [Dehalococcoidia bacterium]